MARSANRFPPDWLKNATDAGKALISAATAAAQAALLNVGFTTTGLSFGGTDKATIKGIYYSGTIVVAVPTIADAEADSVDVNLSALTFAPAVGDAVIAIPLEALPTSCLLNGAYVSATDHVIVSFGTLEGGSGVTGANKNFGFLIFDLT